MPILHHFDDHLIISQILPLDFVFGTKNYNFNFLELMRKGYSCGDDKCSG